MSAINNARADDEPKVRIYVKSNSHMSRGKYAAAAVHAALTAAEVHPGLPVIVLGAQREHVMKHTTVIRDAGRTEVEPGTPTAGTSWAPETAITDAEHDALTSLLMAWEDLHPDKADLIADAILRAGFRRPIHTDGAS